MGSLFNKAAGLKTWNFFKNRLRQGGFLWYCKFFENSFLIQYLQWLLLKVLPRYSKFRWGACSSIFRIDVLSILIKNFHEALHKYFFTITWQNNFFFAWIDWSRAVDFRMCFGKTFLWKAYTKRCASNYVISRVKGHSSLALSSVSGAFNFMVCFGKRKKAV